MYSISVYYTHLPKLVAVLTHKTFSHDTFQRRLGHVILLNLKTYQTIFIDLDRVLNPNKFVPLISNFFYGLLLLYIPF